MDLGILGKTALVLGAGGGLGSAIAVTLAREGVSLALADIDGQALVTVDAAVKGFGVRSKTFVWNLADADEIERNVSEIEASLGPVDMIQVTDRIVPGMRSRRWGRIITSTSSGVIAPIPNLGVSNTLRSALVGWSKSLAREVAADGITANVILPGRIATDRIRFLDEQKAKRENRTLESVVAESTAAIPLARYGRPEEYADVVAFLVSQRASYITGSVIRVDGGYIASI